MSPCLSGIRTRDESILRLPASKPAEARRYLSPEVNANGFGSYVLALIESSWLFPSRIILFYFILFYFILFYFILFYFILFYFILFYFI